ncbi:MAG: biopolymer transporter ExbD [Methylomonas sp.]|nr:biopolymer transporter ExbD [Methylomonas sp.]PPD20719.1 MAG: biopolymer transporter ExbD [Methylomonas sp.]PPD26216.1 MAG: biopolymer transporter ExbD [Methylomonas sp.]PPD37934.1 MAG: biopolymer transporter ExbD [Methylomonas sp.]PPD54620.1 MAG: biopolymer transporter ExbD [Methylomonas sp.]
MGFKTQSDDDEAVADINVTPLVDVMLVLVIILLVTAPLLTQSVNVALPKTASTTPDIEKQPMQLGIDAQGGVTLNKNPIADLTVLETTLQTELAANPELIVHIYADQAVNYGKVAAVMAAAQHAGIAKLAFVTLEH